MHGIPLGTGVKHGVEYHRVQADAPLLYLLIRAEDLFGALGHGEAFEIGGVSHGVDAGPRLLRVRMAVDQLPEPRPGCPYITRASAMQPNVKGPGCSPRAVIYFDSSRTRSTSPICTKDLIMA